VRPTSRVATVNGQPVVQIDEGFDRAWRRVGLTLDRTGFTVEDRDRSQGVYFVRYVEPNPDKKEPGFFGKLFGGSTPMPPAEVPHQRAQPGRVHHRVGAQCRGRPETSANAQRIVNVIADDLK
jgi:outer membrane protein assembly factor BamC